MNTPNYFAVIRIPHQMPAELLLDYPQRESDNDYDSFWDDANSIKTFDNESELAQEWLSIHNHNRGQLYHQSARVYSLITRYFEHEYEYLLCDSNIPLPELIQSLITN